MMGVRGDDGGVRGIRGDGRGVSVSGVMMEV